MGLFRFFFKPIVEAPKMIGTEQLANDWRTIVQLFKRLFVPPKRGQQETFEDSLQRYQLTEQDIQQQKKMFARLTAIFCVVFVISILYGMYLICTGSWDLTTLVIIIVSMLFGAQAFHYHFWWFQLQERRLGCSISEWFHRGLLRQKP